MDVAVADRAMFSVFHYMQSIEPQRAAVLNDMLSALSNFDELFKAVRGMTP